MRILYRQLFDLAIKEETKVSIEEPGKFPVSKLFPDFYVRYLPVWRAGFSHPEGYLVQTPEV